MIHGIDRIDAKGWTGDSWYSPTFIDHQLHATELISSTCIMDKTAGLSIYNRVLIVSTDRCILSKLIRREVIDRNWRDILYHINRRNPLDDEIDYAVTKEYAILVLQGCSVEEMRDIQLIAANYSKILLIAMTMEPSTSPQHSSSINNVLHVCFDDSYAIIRPWHLTW